MQIVLLEESAVKRRIAKWIAVLVIALMGINACALAQGAIDTTVVMRVSHMTQNAVVNAGEDLSIEVNIGGANPDSYQWFFNGAPISGANQKVLNIVNAQPENTGLYRMDAFDENGAMVVSMDIAARVLSQEVPQTGDASMPVAFAFAGLLMCVFAMIYLIRRRAMA